VELLSTQFHISSSSLAQLLVASAWQGLAITAITGVLLKLLPRMSAARRFRIWMAAFVLATVLPFASLFSLNTSWNAPAHVAASTTTVQSAGSFLTLDMYWSWGFLFLWTGLSVFSFARFAAGLLGIHRLLRAAVPVAPSSLPARGFFQGRRKNVNIYVADTLSAPVATGFRRPSIILPRHLLGSLTQEEIRQILLHEFEHLARRDDWTTLFIRALRCVLPLSPALYYIEKQLGRERELACDDAVLHDEASPRGYALCLARMAEMSVNRRKVSLVPGLLGETSQLTARVSHILGPQKNLQEVARLPFAVSLTSMALTASALLYCPNLVSFRALPTPLPDMALAMPATVKPVLAKADISAPATSRHAAITHKAAHHSIAKQQHEPLTLQPLPAPVDTEITKTLVLWQEPPDASVRSFLLLVETTSRTAHSITIERQFFQI
jgi:beta-lactamase regulating signal transducer with metallopeptidase domain